MIGRNNKDQADPNHHPPPVRLNLLFHIYIVYIFQISYLFQAGVFQYFPRFLFFFFIQDERIEFNATFMQILFFFPGFLHLCLHLFASQTFLFRHLRQLGNQCTQIGDSQFRFFPSGANIVTSSAFLKKASSQTASKKGR